MQSKLINFIGTLRDHDVRVSTSESLDAMRVLALIGYEDRQHLKYALSNTLAKTQPEKAIFFRCFEMFFAGDRLTTLSDDKPNSEDGAENGDGEGGEPQDLEAQIADSEELQHALDSPLVQAAISGDNNMLSAEVAKASANLNIDNLRFFTQTGQYTRALLHAVGVEQLDLGIKNLKEINNPTADYLVEVIRNKKQQLHGLAKAYIDEQFILTANADGRKIQEAALRNTQLSTLDKQHFSDLKELVRKLAKKLITKHSRSINAQKRGRLDIGKTLRKNIQNDGILFDTFWKKTPKKKSKVIALCDVSGSVSAYSKFLLLFLYSLSDVLPNIRSFCFSNQSDEVTDLFERYDASEAIDRALKKCGQGSSDYGQSLEDFSHLCLDDINTQTTVIILGDGRTNMAEPRLEILQQIYQQAKTVIWLNPERRSQWHVGDSEMIRYQSACHFVSECQSLNQLERVIDQLLKLMR
jgi:uncharacterized protein with von Willebrand factor type A (vWA) domain